MTVMNEDAVARVREALGRHVPEKAVERLTLYIIQRGVYLRISRQRTSRYGDYRWPQRGRTYHAISVNGNLNKYFFLMVFLHEMAHLETYLRYSNSVRAHGHEWQTQYRMFLVQYRDCFPEDVQPLYGRYIARIPLHGQSGHCLEQQLLHYNELHSGDSLPMLNDLAPGTIFCLAGQPGIRFRSCTKRRTRWVCVELSSGLTYQIKGTTYVYPE
ncbi:MAG: SprT-like domain-containing protein [Bacteroidales bacterium]|nr:SprT-like domain-containing protein [Bacteroidales bacterium]